MPPGNATRSVYDGGAALWFEQTSNIFAEQGIAAGFYDIVLAGGLESMSHVPRGFLINGPKGIVAQGIPAEPIAFKWGIIRRESDKYSACSHQLAESGRFADDCDREIVAIRTSNDGVSRHDTIRPETTVQDLSELKVSFENVELARRFPEVPWSTTAGNSFQVTDGAAVAFLVSRTTTERLGLPRARVSL